MTTARAAPPYFVLDPLFDQRPVDAIAVLFVGTSHTYYHSMPQIAERVCARPMSARVVAHPLRSLADHLASDELASALESTRWDVVVLQEMTTLPLQRFDEHLAAVESVCERARRTSPDATFVLQRHWPRARWHSDYETRSDVVGRDPDEMFARLRAATERVADRLDVVIAPVGDAWMRAKIPPQRLYYRGGNHANLAGAILAAHVHATIIAGRPSRALGFRHEMCWEIAEPLAAWAHEAVDSRVRTVRTHTTSHSAVRAK